MIITNLNLQSEIKYNSFIINLSIVVNYLLNYIKTVNHYTNYLNITTN